MQEVAEKLNVSDRTVRRRIKEGKLKAEKKATNRGQRYFIKEEDLQELVRNEGGDKEVVEVMKKIDNAEDEKEEYIQKIDKANQELKDKIERIQAYDEEISLVMQMKAVDEELETSEVEELQKERLLEKEKRKDLMNLVDSLELELEGINSKIEQLKVNKARLELEKLSKERLAIDKEIENNVSDLRDNIMKLYDNDIKMRNISKIANVNFTNRRFTSLIEGHMNQVLRRVEKCPVGEYGFNIQKGRLTENDSMAHYKARVKEV